MTTEKFDYVNLRDRVFFCWRKRLSINHFMTVIKAVTVSALTACDFSQVDVFVLCMVPRDAAERLLKNFRIK